uniref:PDZ domain-containing protein n=1 Tax=Periophthalmus magnuspinnatus TaxID=409849 RepID=A0A3B4AYE3_9GOBI
MHWICIVPQGSLAAEEGRFYSVDLERGPTGFGFSLRGGSEYNMGLYVLGLMQGGPAQRSNKIQVSDQLVEINGDSTAGMTHSQAVDQIRRGGNHIHLVLKRGNGYVPDYEYVSRSLRKSHAFSLLSQCIWIVTLQNVCLIKGFEFRKFTELHFYYHVCRNCRSNKYIKHICNKLQLQI